jgi:hypothetical protein
VGEGQDVREQSVLLDIAGRKVLNLHSGPNDLRRLRAGVYFIRLDRIFRVVLVD